MFVLYFSVFVSSNTLVLFRLKPLSVQKRVTLIVTLVGRSRCRITVCVRRVSHSSAEGEKLLCAHLKSEF